jgi:hypothetical protein
MYILCFSFVLLAGYGIVALIIEASGGMGTVNRFFRKHPVESTFLAMAIAAPIAFPAAALVIYALFVMGRERKSIVRTTGRLK